MLSFCPNRKTVPAQAVQELVDLRIGYVVNATTNVRSGNGGRGIVWARLPMERAILEWNSFCEWVLDPLYNGAPIMSELDFTLCSLKHETPRLLSSWKC